MKKMIVLICVLGISIAASAGLTVVDATNRVWKTTTGGQTLYWYMALEDSAAGSGASRADQIAFADNLSIDVDGVGVIDSWGMADVDDIEALFGSAVVTEVTHDPRTGKPLKNPYTEITYPDAPVDDIIAAVVTPTGWAYSLGHFYGRYTDPDNPTAMLGFERSLLSWSIDPDTYTTPDYVSHDYQGAWIVAVPEPMTLGILGLGSVFLRKRK